ncbi:hydrogenase 4 subunit B [Psychromonas sp. CNPT3]|uniref:hydrogenase 4 subunit B n=1 Tax=Psychromonas sp. CNPT3 TaxID=314282 RepID=UPI00006E8922|nr:hydrogenase 4 subunit B [Psychromonas sp. CNPT3]AGH82390.1 hydrogenase 4 subunit B [Psychromonas sp. CNPT3]
MVSFNLLFASIALYVVAGVISLLLSSKESIGIALSGVVSTLGGVLGVCASLPVLFGSDAISYQISSPFYFADCMLRLDPLSSLMVFIISLVVIACSIYSLSYMQEYKGKGAWAMGFFMNVFIASMVALVVSENAFYFIVFFEMMSLASYFLVISEQKETSINAGLQYFLIAHAGSVLIMIAFFILYRATGSLNFQDFRTANLSSGMASIVFLLAFFGFGAKAGIISLHSWLPLAHPAAPSNASALMSGVMVKIGIFGIIKVSIDFLGADTPWWGYLVLAFGAVSSVLGVLYALAEHDIKRLLAYHTVENVGIILMGVGVGMVGIATHHPVLATIGLLGGLYHMLNHAVFKGLLFLGAGSIVFRLHTKDMDKMGGLGKLMPYTAIAFLIGTMAISALPPLNGFISEWFIYQSLLTMGRQGDLMMSIGSIIAVVMLALTGALACMCFVKVYGVCFAGAPKSKASTNATEVPIAMLIGTSLLALMCIVLGIGSPWIAPVIKGVAASLVKGGVEVTVSQGVALVPGIAHQAILSAPIIAISLLLLLLIPYALITCFKGQKLKRRHSNDPWACGYGYEQRMSVDAGSFTCTLRAMYAPLYTLREKLDPAGLFTCILLKTTAFAVAIEACFEDHLVSPMTRMLRRMKGGSVLFYGLYLLIALVVLMLIPFYLGVK